MRIRLRLLDSIVEIRTDDEAAAWLLELVWTAMRTDDPEEPVRVYDIARDGKGGWIATAGDDVEAIGGTLWGVTDALRYRMLELCEEKLETFVSVHAAAVARDDYLILLAGESGAGKTTLTLALLDAGWTYLTDDYAPVSRSTALVHPFPKPLGVKDPEVWQRVRAAFRDGPELPPPEGSFLVPPTLWDVGTRPLSARALLFPKYAAGGDLRVESLTPAKAAAIATGYLRQLDPSTLALLNRVSASAAAFHVRYGSSAAAIAFVEDLVVRG